MGNPIVLISVEDTGHPTDRSTCRTLWSPPEHPGRFEAISHAFTELKGSWDWRRGSTPVRLGDFTAHLNDGALQVKNANNTIVVHLSLPEAVALAASADATMLYVGTSTGLVLALPVTRTESA
jgi:hypothetical protein